MGERTAGEMAAALSLLLHQKLGVKGGGLEAKLARAGRLLPRRVHRQATEIVEAERREGHPRLSRQIDRAALARTFRSVEKHLTKIDPAERRKGTLLSILGSIALGLIVLFGGIVAFLVWRDLL